MNYFATNGLPMIEEDEALGEVAEIYDERKRELQMPFVPNMMKASAAHTLKSGSADFGAISLSKLCEQLENMGKAGTLEGTEILVGQVEVIYEQVRIALTDIRNQQD